MGHDDSFSIIDSYRSSKKRFMIHERGKYPYYKTEKTKSTKYKYTFISSIFSIENFKFHGLFITLFDFDSPKLSEGFYIWVVHEICCCRWI